MDIQVLVQNEIENASKYRKDKMYAVWEFINWRGKEKNIAFMGCLLVNCSQTFSDKWVELVDKMSDFTDIEHEKFSLFILDQMDKLKDEIL